MLEHGEKFLSCGASGLLMLLFSEHMPPPTSVLCSWLYLSNRLLLLLWFGVSVENGFVWVSFVSWTGASFCWGDRPVALLGCHKLGSVGECWTAPSSLGMWPCVKKNKNSLLGTRHSQHLPCLCLSLIHQAELVMWPLDKMGFRNS